MPRVPRLALASLFVLTLAACGKEKDNKDTKPSAEPGALAVPSAPPPAPPPSVVASAAPSAVSPVVDLIVGTGKEVHEGSKVKVHYTIFYTNGKQFESSHDKNKPKSFIVGAGQVIKGWDSGVVGMKVGGKRKLTIPPELAYGAKGALPTIPGNATLIFEIELLEAS
jgi:FKBP-type peptidyl-prolyl cis-trans isomerase FkpA